MTATPPLRQSVPRQTQSDTARFKEDALADVEKLRKILETRFSSEDGYGRSWSNAILARFTELIENRVSLKRALDTIADSQKLAMAQMQFAQTVVHQLERSVEELKHANGKSLAYSDNFEPDVNLKGE